MEVLKIMMNSIQEQNLNRDIEKVLKLYFEKNISVKEAIKEVEGDKCYE